MRKRLPYLFLTLLVIIFMFILGVNYGRRVTQTNAIISYLMSVTPSQSPENLNTSLLQFETYTHKTCGIQFVYPKAVEKRGESSTSATFLGKSSKISINCEGTVPTTPLSATTREVRLKTQKVPVNIITQDGEKVYLMQIKHPRTGKSIFVEISENLLPLFESTFQIIP